ncbi:hypothetical protein E2C01_080751 [Portunus trituberculatus]|uniref:Uncharacterized protein n=1 Tax=Portunus trituberculatus TaxID=210409 RepID=A0A5B7IU04_PORTR|nr:hypothetical protein [Portunus trituberculatus]
MMGRQQGGYGTGGMMEERHGLVSNRTGGNATGRCGEITVWVRGQQSVRRHQQERARRGWSAWGEGVTAGRVDSRKVSKQRGVARQGGWENRSQQGSIYKAMKTPENLKPPKR